MEFTLEPRRSVIRADRSSNHFIRNNPRLETFIKAEKSHRRVNQAAETVSKMKLEDI